MSPEFGAPTFVKKNNVFFGASRLFTAQPFTEISRGFPRIPQMASAQRSSSAVSSQDVGMAVVAKTDDARSIVNILTAIHLKKEIVRGRGRARARASARVRARVHEPPGQAPAPASTAAASGRFCSARA